MESFDDILQRVEEKESIVHHMVDQVKGGKRIFKSDSQEGIIHPSSKRQTSYQFSYFDQWGVVGDIERDNIPDLVTTINDLGFKLASLESLDYIY